MNKRFFLPQSLRSKIVDITKETLEKNTLNFGLFLEKYILWSHDEKGKIRCDPTIQIAFLRKVKNNPQKVKVLLRNSNISEKEFKEELMKNERLRVPFEVLPTQHYRIYRMRFEMFISDFEKLGYFVKLSQGFPIKWRLTINLGAASVYETSLLFHRNYSIPYIPGSAVKGITHHYALVLKKKGEVNQKKMDGIFGTPDNKGEVIFFDALPIIEDDKDFIVFDVMNVHYGEYYRDNKGTIAPGDWMSPNPIFFLTVEGIKFKFAVASRNETLAEEAMRLLRGALSEIGIGAKTSSGYGYFAT